MAAKKDKDTVQLETADDFLQLNSPFIPKTLNNVLLVFSNNIPEDARAKCALNSGVAFPVDGDPAEQRVHLLGFVSERLDMVSRRESALWLNGLLPFITPRELFIWRLRQYVEFIWAFQLPDDDDLSMIFNSTRLKAANLTADFTARFRKALLYPIALRRLYRILRGEDPNYGVVAANIEYKKAYGRTFRIPSSRYVQDANALIDEFRLRDAEGGYLRDAALVSREQNIMWVSHDIADLANDDELRQELFRLYEIPREGGNLG
jgi:hypothetical protein